MRLLFKLPQNIEGGKKLTATCIKVNPDGTLLFQDVASTKTYKLNPDVIRAHFAKNQRGVNEQVSDNEEECGSRRRRLTRTEKEKRDVCACLKDIAAKRAKLRAEEEADEQ